MEQRDQRQAGAAAGEHGSILRSRFIDNIGGALETCGHFDVADSLFANNSADLGGAISGSINEHQCSAQITVSNSAFIGNSAMQGGAIYCHTDFFHGSASVDVVNSQFVGNHADEGGAIYGPVRVEASSFADNTAMEGAALSGGIVVGPTQDEFIPAPGELHTCVLWPDDVSASVSNPISNSCIPTVMQGFADLGGNAELLADPFVRTDLDDDGFEELYLDPASPCVDLGGSVADLDWSEMTTQVSQCTDAGLLDAGVHHVPLQDVGVCG